MFLQNTMRRVLFVGLAAAATQSVALAGHRSHSHADADIDSLDASLRGGVAGWRLTVRYEIEIDDAFPGEAFDLMLHVTERRRTLADRYGRPLQFRVPLDFPTHAHGDELEFESRVSLALPPGAFHDAQRLRLHAVVVSRTTGRTLDHDDESVRFHGRRYGRGHGYEHGHHGSAVGGRVDAEFYPPARPTAAPIERGPRVQTRRLGQARRGLRPQVVRSREIVADSGRRLGRRRSM